MSAGGERSGDHLVIAPTFGDAFNSRYTSIPIAMNGADIAGVHRA